MFLLKALSDDLLYYGHERQNEVSRPLHYILVDGSASMRGAREVFARGLALALAKKLSLVGGKSADVWVRFFDSRLHPRIDLGRSARPRSAAPAGLPFAARPKLRARVRRSGASRSAGWCATRVGTSRSRSSRTAPARFRSPRSRRWRAQVRLYGIFVLPSGPLELDYLPFLHRSQVVTAASLGRTADKRRRALEIVEDAARL